MNRAQKVAWFNLAIMLAGVVLVMVFAIMDAVKLVLAIFLVMVAIVGISPLLFRDKRGHIGFDERDQLIRLRALFFASFVSFCWLTAQCLLQVFLVGLRGSIPVGKLVATVCGALFTFVITKSGWTLFEYRYGKK